MLARITLVTLFAAASAIVATSAARQAPAPPVTAPGDWPSYGRDLGNSRYSPLDQITRDNVATLRVAWRWKSDNFSVPAEYRNESTPIMVNGTLYFTAGATRWVVAADATTGATKWAWHLDEGDRARRAPRRDSGRGVSYWSSGPDRADERVFTVTPGFQLVALDAKTGLPVGSFGDKGVVDLKAQLGVQLDPATAAIGSSSPPLVFDNVVVIGPALEVGTRPPSMKNVPGRILAIDARTGKLLWRFNTIPQAGEAGVETWEDNSWQYTGNAGAWAPLTLDDKRGYLYLPVEDATGDYYGGHRKGDNLFSSTLVCLDARTGKRVWHFQIVHHDIWDRDNAAAPILADITVGGRRIEAVVQLSKQAYAYVFDRVTGAPVWPIVEQAVPQSDVPGEKTAATQPIPSKPAGFDRQNLTADDVLDFTPELHAEALKAIAAFKTGGGPFAPPSVDNGAGGTRGTILMPGNLGGGNWEGGSFDPESGWLYVGSWTSPAVIALVKDAQRSDMDWVGGGGGVPRVRGLPISKPPYSRVTAINLNTGDHAWMMPNGDTPPDIKNNPALAGLTIPRTGAQTRPEILATKTLLFVGEGSGAQPMLHVLDKATGATITDIVVPGSIGSVPMSYALGGRQFIAFWVADRNPAHPAELVTLALPGPGRGGGGE
jgi:quinoprotein glucose dehydrogenase